METISPQTSPTGSISPPVTPFSIALPHTYALPPLKTLPTWNRNKFKDDKLVRSVPKNKNIKVELIGQIGQIENCTQTSPYSSSSENGFSSAKASSSSKKTENSKNNVNKLKKSYDKKIIFLETTHKEVLSNLHRELETLKNQNRALKFQLVMAGEDTSRLQFDTDEKCNNKPINNEVEQTKVLKGEIRELKKLLSEADSRNVYLTKLIEQLKQRSSASRLKSGNLSKSKSIPRHKSDYSINLLRKDSSSTKASLKQDDEQDGGGLKKEKEKQNEVSLLDEKHEKQYSEKNTLFPKLEQPTTYRSAPITSYAPTTKRIQEPLSLPILQGLPANRNMALRQKRARALHVRRQRSNKNVSITAATMTTTNDE